MRASAREPHSLRGNQKALSQTAPKSEGRRIRVLVADDHPIVRAGLLALIDGRPDMRVVAEAANWPEAVEKFFQQQPDVALLDLRMPGMDGVTAIHTIRSQIASARVILITLYDGDEDIYRCLRAGARGYLLKDSPRDELVSGIRAVYEGKTCIPSAIASKLVDRLSMPAVSKRELDVLRLMAAGKSNKEIAALLGITEGTVKTHMNHILKKLKVGGRMEAAIQALRRGFVHLDD